MSNHKEKFSGCLNRIKCVDSLKHKLRCIDMWRVISKPAFINSNKITICELVMDGITCRLSEAWKEDSEAILHHQADYLTGYYSRYNHLYIIARNEYPYIPVRMNKNSYTGIWSVKHDCINVYKIFESKLFMKQNKAIRI